ncbi:MAG TPA: MMPL family transporter, partial [Streptosporangiaceae bacterium]|nr:MMPL family transporter [Streptosporangiaceae bacterium]
MNRFVTIASLPAGRRTKWMVLAFWLVLAVVSGPVFSKLTGVEKNDASSWLPPKAESTQVLNLRSHFVSPNVYPAVIVYDRPAGLTAADKAKITADAGGFKSVAGVIGAQVAAPSFSADGQAAETIVPVDLGSKGWSGAGKAADALRAIAQSGSQGLTVHVAGTLGYAADSGKAFNGIDGTLLFAALAVVIVLLLFTYRSPVLWLLPVISAAIALNVAVAVVYLLAKHGLTVNGQSAGILNVLVFGAGTDYALLLTARYREELR